MKVWQENMSVPHRDSEESMMETRVPAASAFFNLDSHAYMIELLPTAAYAVRAPDGVIAWFNARAAELWGRIPVAGDTDERFCGAHRLHHPNGTYMAHCDTPLALVLRTGVSIHEQEVEIERPDGSRVTVSVHIDPIRDKDGSIVGAVNFFHDITERKQAERTNTLLAAIVGSSDDAIVSKNLDGMITSWNKGAERLFGHTAEEAVGKHVTLIIPADRLDEETKILEQLKRGERVDHFETIRMHKDGTLLDISLTISPLKDSAGRVVGASKVARDITERKRVQAQLRKSEEQLRTLADDLERQVRSRTQELEQRNADVLRQSDQLRELSNRLLQTQDNERRHIARELHDSAGQIIAALAMNLASMADYAMKNPMLGKTVEDSQSLIQQLNREIRTTSYLLHPPLLDESGLPEAIRWYMQGLMERSGLSIDLNIAEDFGRLPSEMELTVFRIVQECLTNIHRHSGSKTATIRLSRNPDGVTLEIQDEGRGMPAEKLNGIHAQRSGVGITGMRERVRHLKGSMDIRANGTGTTISVALPVLTTEIPELGNILQEQGSGIAG
jgi:PAS domain S-box-containing protein